MVSSGSPAMLAVRRFGASALRRFGASANVAATTPVGNTAGRLRRHSPGKADLPPGFHSPGRADLPPGLHSPDSADLPPGFHSPGRVDLPPVATGPVDLPAATAACSFGKTSDSASGNRLTAWPNPLT